MPTAYPTAIDLRKFLQASGMISFDFEEKEVLLNLQAHLEQAIEYVEKYTGYDPFIADSSDQTIVFSSGSVQYLNPPRMPFLDFASDGGPGGMISVTSVTVGVSPTFAGTTLTPDSEYRLYPRNATLKAHPYTQIELLFRPARHSEKTWIEVVGKRGYAANVPSQVFNAILQKASSILAVQIAQSVTGGLIEWAEAGVRERYPTQAMGAFIDRLGSNSTLALAPYRRMRVA